MVVIVTAQMCVSVWTLMFASITSKNIESDDINVNPEFTKCNCLLQIGVPERRRRSEPRSIENDWRAAQRTESYVHCT